ncbi:MAG: FadD3 family acyl-CoA ligase [Candidatus Sphingomonas colombiensis]|nr:FadD3 family acyl-CoA ligase [Sphingomonas sp.]WEK42014.1 MAG: FadD3 family acyl-CoA ligase [Sphingomonas sp.]
MALPPTIPHLAAEAAARFGDRPALLGDDENWSFAELWRRSRAAASAFLARGVVSGDRIAIWAPNRREWIVATIGAQAIGAAIVPLNTRLKGREAGDILRRTGARMLFTVGDFLGVDYPALLAGEELPALDQTLLFDRDWNAFIAAGAGADDPRVTEALAALGPDALSDIMFTSGTTGVPKGVLTTHGRIIPMFKAWGDAVGLREGDVYLIVNPFFHSFGFKAGWVAALIAGATIVPMATFDVARAIDHIEQDRVSFIPGPPTIFQSLLAERAFDSSSLRCAVTGAATVPPILIERMQRELGFQTVVTAYGMTECSAITSCRQGDSVELVASSCGKALPGLEVKCADDAGREVPRGQEGEVLVRGYGVMLGYLDDPAATAEAIDADGWLHTGDVGVMDEADYLRITDRKKDMYISGGFNCYPAEIEKLLSAHPAIGAVAVVGVPDERMGEIGHAFVVLRPGASVDGATLIGWARANMANYKAPRRVTLLDALPLNASGKVVKPDLRALAERDAA